MTEEQPAHLEHGGANGLVRSVRIAAERFGDTPVLVSAGGWPVSYADLDRFSDELAATLHRDHDIGEGDVVALTLPSTPEYTIAYAAVAKLGAITTGVNPRLTPAEQSSVLAVAQPALVLCERGMAPADHRSLEVAIADRPDALFRELRTDGDVPPPLPDENDPERLVAIVFTSGTTGLPKGAMFGNRELAAIANSDLGPRVDTWGGGGAMLASTQFAHIGAMTKLPWYLQMGTTTYLLDRWRAADVLRLVHDHRMASIGGIAPQVALMLRDPSFDDYDFSCVQTIIMGGAFSPPAMVEEARRRFGASYSIRYSSTESGGVGTGTAFDADDDEALHTIGRPREGVEVEIRAEDGSVCAPGEVGELCLRSACMMRGYWNDPEATAEVLRDGWLHNGDLAYVDDRGLLRLAGRRKEMYIRGGYNVYPVEVEGVLSTHPAIADIAIVPRPDAVMGELGVAIVVPRDPAAPPTLEDLRTFAQERLARYKLPEAIELVDELPLTSLSKIDRRALAEAQRSRVEKA